MPSQSRCMNVTTWADCICHQEYPDAPNSYSYAVTGQRDILLRTKSHRDMESGSRLHIAMEFNTELAVSVQPAVNWQNGRIKFLELVDFCS